MMFIIVCTQHVFYLLFVNVEVAIIIAGIGLSLKQKDEKLNRDIMWAKEKYLNEFHCLFMSDCGRLVVLLCVTIVESSDEIPMHEREFDNCGK